MKAMKPLLNALLVTAAVITLSGAAMAQDTGTTTAPDTGTTGTTTFDADTTTGTTGSADTGATGATGAEAQLNTEQVQQLEQTLSNRGYSISLTDGIMDSQTEAALREFQEDNDLAVTGTATSETLAELGMEAGAGAGAMQTPDTTDSTETDTSGSMD